jgi:hypothetical protein
VSLLRPTSATVAAAPRTAPAPNAAFRKPAPPAPASRREIAVATIRMSSAPITMSSAEVMPTNRSWSWSRRRMRKPADISRSTRSSASRGGGASRSSSLRMRETTAPPRRQTTAITANTVAGSETCNSTPATNGPRRMPALSIIPRRNVRGGEVLRRVGDRGKERGLHRPREGDAARGEGGERVDDRDRSAGVHRDRDGSERAGLEEVVGEQHAVLAEPVGRVGGDRRDHRCRKELDHRDETGGRRPASCVCEHEDRDPGGELRHVEAGEGDLDP